MRIGSKGGAGIPLRKRIDGPALVVHGMMFASGAAALTYEVVWVRQLTGLLGASAVASPGVSAGLRSVEMEASSLPAKLELMDRRALDAYLGTSGSDLPLNTDDLPITEFTTPRDMIGGRTAARFVGLGAGG